MDLYPSTDGQQTDDQSTVEIIIIPNVTTTFLSFLQQDLSKACTLKVIYIQHPYNPEKSLRHNWYQKKRNTCNFVQYIIPTQGNQLTVVLKDNSCILFQ